MLDRQLVIADSSGLTIDLDSPVLLTLLKHSRVLALPPTQLEASVTIIYQDRNVVYGKESGYLELGQEGFVLLDVRRW